VKPLLANKFTEFLERFDNFKDTEFRSVEVNSATSMQVTFAAQDRARAFDWITITLELNGVSDAKLLDHNRLSLVDISDGISLIANENSIGFAIGEYKNLSSITNATCYIVGNDLKYREGQF